MAYKKQVAEKLSELKEVKKHLEEAEDILKNIQSGLFGEDTEFNCAKSSVESALRFLNGYMELVKYASPIGHRAIRVPERRYI